MTASLLWFLSDLLDWTQLSPILLEISHRLEIK